MTLNAIATPSTPFYSTYLLDKELLNMSTHKINGQPFLEKSNSPFMGIAR